MIPVGGCWAEGCLQKKNQERKLGSNFKKTVFLQFWRRRFIFLFCSHLKVGVHPEEKIHRRRPRTSPWWWRSRWTGAPASHPPRCTCRGVAVLDGGKRKNIMTGRGFAEWTKSEKNKLTSVLFLEPGSTGIVRVCVVVYRARAKEIRNNNLASPTQKCGKDKKRFWKGGGGGAPPCLSIAPYPFFWPTNLFHALKCHYSYKRSPGWTWPKHLLELLFIVNLTLHLLYLSRGKVQKKKTTIETFFHQKEG